MPKPYQLIPNLDLDMIPSRNYPRYDLDPRPKSQPCYICARDIEHGEKCICVPSMPANGNVVVMARGFRIAQS